MENVIFERAVKPSQVSQLLNGASEKIISEIAEVAGFLWQRGWAERNAGNISLQLQENELEKLTF